MDWFYEYCDTEEFKRPANNLNFSQFCLVAHVWLKSKSAKLNEDDRVWLMTELLERGRNCSLKELGLLIDCTRLAVKRGFEAKGLVEWLEERLERVWPLEDSLLIENALKLFLLLRKEPKWIQKLIIPHQPQAFDDFCFVPYERDELALQIHVQRKLVFFNPFLLTPEQFNYVFIDSESEFIKALHKMLQTDPKKFLKFYTELLPITVVDMFVSDSPVHVSFFKALSISKLKFPLSVRQFHTLLQLKCELESENHELLPFLPVQ